jgi:hypothetical protein
VVIMATVNPCHAGLILDGGFEFPAISPGTEKIINFPTTPSGFPWIITSGSVDLLNLPVAPTVLFSAYEGNQALNLNGFERGTISQTFVTTPGQKFTLTLAYANNPNASGASTASVTLSDSLGVFSSDTISHSTSTNSPANADWQVFSLTFQARDFEMQLDIASTSGSSSTDGGIILDAVSVDPAVAAVPEPSTAALLVSVAVAAMACGWRRRQRIL